MKADSLLKLLVSEFINLFMKKRFMEKITEAPVAPYVKIMLMETSARKYY